MQIEHSQARKTRGFTLTEAAIVLGIVGLILGAIWVAAASVYKNVRVKRVSEQILTTVQGIRSMYATSPVATGLAAGVGAGSGSFLLGQAGVLPSDLLTKDAAGAITGIANVWGGAVNIISAANPTLGDSFTVNMEAVPQAECIDILVRSTGQGHDSGLVRAGVGAGANVGLVAATAFPTGMTATQAAGQCANAVANIVSFTFRLKS